MVKNIKDIGKMVNKMEKENFIFLLKINGKKESGKTVKEYSGLKLSKII
jgi:hypothetical protein